MNNKFIELREALEKGSKMLIISHNRPDGDTTGANLALRLYLQKLSKDVTSACADLPPEHFAFLPEVDKFVDEFLLEDFDTVVIVDAGARHLVRFFETYPELGRTKKPIICIDHHYSNDQFGTVNVIDPEETSTTSLLFKYFKSQNIEIDQQMATCLLNGIYTDTGSFMHSNTKAETMKMASELMALGADIRSISKFNFQTTSANKLKLMGEVLSNIQYDYAEDRIISGVKNETLEKYNATSDDLSGVVDFINSVPKARYTVLYTEDDHGGVKGSLRTRHDDVNVAKIAETFGGGGHSKAAGFRVHGRLAKDIQWQVTPEEKTS